MSAASASSPSKRKHDNYDNQENLSPAKRSNGGTGGIGGTSVKEPYTEDDIAARNTIFKSTVSNVAGDKMRILVLKNNAYANSEARRARAVTAIGMKTEEECTKKLLDISIYYVSMNGGKSYIEAYFIRTGVCQDKTNRARNYFVFMGMDDKLYTIDHTHFDNELAVIAQL